jgi:hypothetical protein
VLHPRFKSSYFVKAKWPHEWITTAQKILKDEWTKNYKVAAVTSTSDTPVSSFFFCHLTVTKLNNQQAPSSKKDYFAELDDLMADVPAGDTLDEWLASPPLATVTDPIAWWLAMEAAGHPLSRMSLNFLSVPGMFII